MKRKESHRAASGITQKIPRKKPHAWNQVFNERKQRVRGLWERNGTYYAQLTVAGRQARHRLESATVPQAVTEMRVLKRKAQLGTLPTPGTKEGQTPPPKKGQTIADAIAEYQRHTALLGVKDSQTIEREGSGFKAWNRKFGSVALDKVNDALLKAFAEWRKTLDGGEVSGRTVDLDVRALRHALNRAVEIGWLEKLPIGRWSPMAKKPEKTRLISSEELDRLCAAAIPSPTVLKFTDPALRGAGRAFADYLRLLAYSGGREQETIQLRWSHVDWKRKVLHFVGGKRGGGSQEAGEPRDVDFHDKLEALLKEMHQRRNPKSDWMFPSYRVDGPMRDFRKQLRRVKKDTGTTDLGFHHFRHYFISQAVMAGVDFATIALWVSHRDGGVLIGKIYGHLSREHPARMARKMDTAF